MQSITQSIVGTRSDSFDASCRKVEAVQADADDLKELEELAKKSRKL